jgi:uncharacterized protein
MLDTSLMREVERSKFDAPEAIIHLFIGGSELHGAKGGLPTTLIYTGSFWTSQQ